MYNKGQPYKDRFINKFMKNIIGILQNSYGLPLLTRLLNTCHYFPNTCF